MCDHADGIGTGALHSTCTDPVCHINVTLARVGVCILESVKVTCALIGAVLGELFLLHSLHYIITDQSDESIQVWYKA